MINIPLSETDSNMFVSPKIDATEIPSKPPKKQENCINIIRLFRKNYKNANKASLQQIESLNIDYFA